MKNVLILIFCLQFIGCDVTEINIAPGNSLNKMSDCNAIRYKLIIEQNNISEEYTGYLTNENLKFRIHFKNGINYEEPVLMKIYPINAYNEIQCNIYLQAINIKLMAINKEMKIYEADISLFSLLQI